ncbi:MAG: SOS response-associated peptidase [Desulfobacterales bacterium]|jgi:putative SOS response-associated peptidase YedK
MCGRFVRHSSLELIEKTFNVDRPAFEVTQSYNIAPTQAVLAVVRNGHAGLVQLHWGLVPFFAKDASGAARMINARSETLATKPSFRNAFRKRRCLIVADGFYEWTGPKGQKQAWYISLPTDGPFGFAGLWEVWRADDRKTEIRSCTIITADASPGLRDIHNRMPVILRAGAYDAWLDPANQNAERLRQILQNDSHVEFERTAVSSRVNYVGNTGAGCIEPLQGDADENHAPA